MKKYTPNPANLDDVALPDEFVELMEQIAKNVHEVWSENRLKEGWAYGKERNDSLKQHPCLVPYESLPEIEREYDRATALASLKLIYKLGFKIVKEEKTN